MKTKRQMNEEDWLAVWSREGERVKAAVRGIGDAVPPPKKPAKHLGSLEIVDLSLLALCLVACVALVVLQGFTSQWSDRLIYSGAAALLAVGAAAAALLLAKGVGRHDMMAGVFRRLRCRGYAEVSAWLTAALLLSLVAALSVAQALPPRLEYAEAVTTGGSLAEKQALVDDLLMRTVL